MPVIEVGYGRESKNKNKAAACYANGTGRTDQVRNYNQQYISIRNKSVT
jgi:hypothetical protein